MPRKRQPGAGFRRCRRRIPALAEIPGPRHSRRKRNAQAMSGSPRQLLTALFDAAVAAARPDLCVPPHLPPPPKGRTIVLGAGKASAAMAKAVEDNWQGSLEGIVVTRYGHGVPCRRIRIVEAAHPVPDAAGRAAAERIFELAKSAGPDDLVLCLISGGGSALLALPAPGLTLEDKQAVNRALLASGADIGQMNVARDAGAAPLILGDSIEGEAREVAKVMAGIALQVRRHGQPAPAPCVLLSGGETTVTLRGKGRGGGNLEFLLALAIALDGHPGIHALAADTDG